jgi:undecaprenyl-diphosphatase
LTLDRRGLIAAGTVVLLLAAAALVGALVLLETPLRSAVARLDTTLLLATREGPGQVRWVRRFFEDGTTLGGHTVAGLVALLASGFLFVARKPAAAMLMLASVCGGMLLNECLKAAFGRARPTLVPHLVEAQSSSFPSGHTMLAAATYLTVAGLLTRVVVRRAERRFILCAGAGITLIVGVSRVYLGVHWPSDVVAGWLIGTAWALACWLVARALQKRGAVEPPFNDRRA